MMAYTPKDFLVWGEIPVTDMDAATRFYQHVTGAELELVTDGPNPMLLFRPKDPANGVALSIYPGTPAPDGVGPTLHLAAEGALAEVMTRVTDAGGQVVSEAVSLPGGHFFYAKDPDGNSVGFYEATG
ncbi:MULTISPECIES: VOC family protein [Phaeobacter]|uniref:Enzyme n=3 Tax=Roseobacteraceae TaxID=2854170 RepID=A0A2I7G9D8_9RHOB|nr:VOC family protein [Phaeobacter inhibens]AUQ50201.1 putative enzyme [Phaeobacter inhibens]AUQ54068.1 putative enzyme [Phaeobacter inhibens]AUQ62414.1 putative enzyme [Phaeobacter inhibens]AUQ66742.1 putative enzyme [Phaeobacter inhibens]AUQ78084.1 putative enzyme [Phaeobacter inhibens]